MNACLGRYIFGIGPAFSPVTFVESVLCHASHNHSSSGGSRTNMGSGEWGVGSGEWGVGSGEWGVGSGEWGVGSGEFMP